MSNNLIKFDIAMNMIKEELVRDLSDSVSKLSKNRSELFNDVSFSEKEKD